MLYIAIGIGAVVLLTPLIVLEVILEYAGRVMYYIQEGSKE